MAKRLTFLIFAYLAFQQCLPKPQMRDDNDETDSIPVEIFKFYNNLNAEEKKQLQELRSDSSNTFSLNDNKFIDTVKETGAGLALKLIGLRDILNNQLDGLEPTSRGFIEEIIRKFLAVFAEGGGFMDILSRMKDLGRHVMEEFDRLPETTRQDLNNAFPITTSIATNDIIRFFLNKIADYDPSALIFAGTTQGPKPYDRRATKAYPTYPTDGPQPSFESDHRSTIYPAVPADGPQPSFESDHRSTIYPAVPADGDDIEEPVEIKLTSNNV